MLSLGSKTNVSSLFVRFIKSLLIIKNSSMYVKSIFLLITIMTFVALKPVKSVSPFVFYVFREIAFDFASMHAKIFIIIGDSLSLKFPISFFRSCKIKKKGARKNSVFRLTADECRSGRKNS